MHLITHFRRNAVAYVALFVALGGTSYAAVKLPANSVGARELKTNAVTSRDVKNGSLLAKDFRSGQLPAGPQGPKGDPGPKGDTGTVDTSQFFDKVASDARYAQKCRESTLAGFVKVFAASSFPSTPTAQDVYGWSCSGQAIEAKRTGTGDYMVAFPGQEGKISFALATADSSNPGASVQVSTPRYVGGAGTGWPDGTPGYDVRVRDANGNGVDAPFQLVALPVV